MNVPAVGAAGSVHLQRLAAAIFDVDGEQHELRSGMPLRVLTKNG